MNSVSICSVFNFIFLSHNVNYVNFSNAKYKYINALKISNQKGPLLTFSQSLIFQTTKGNILKTFALSLKKRKWITFDFFHLQPGRGVSFLFGHPRILNAPIRKCFQKHCSLICAALHLSSCRVFRRLLRFPIKTFCLNPKGSTPPDRPPMEDAVQLRLPQQARGHGPWIQHWYRPAASSPGNALFSPFSTYFHFRWRLRNIEIAIHPIFFHGLHRKNTRLFSGTA